MTSKLMLSIRRGPRAVKAVSGVPRFRRDLLTIGVERRYNFRHMSSGRPTVLVISAHAADFCSRSGGTLHKYVKRGSGVHVIDLSFGERGESGEYWAGARGGSVSEAKAVRKSEAEAAAHVLGVSIAFMDWNDYPLVFDRDRITELAKTIRRIAPDILLTHWSRDPFNADHQETSWAVVRACSCASAPGVDPEQPPTVLPEIFLFESSVPQTEFNAFRPDTYVDISDVFEVKMAALRKLESQPFLVDYYTRYAEYRGFQASKWFKTDVRHAEGFSRYTPWIGDELPATRRGGR